MRVLVAVLLLLGALIPGCAGQSSDVDDKPFRQAIESYLQRNNMELAIKEIKAGPVVADDKTASLTASLTHAELGGPSVTWQFQFATQPDGSWQVTSHQD